MLFICFKKIENKIQEIKLSRPLHLYLWKILYIYIILVG